MELEQPTSEVMEKYGKALDKCLPDTLRQSLSIEDKIIEYICIHYGLERVDLMARNREAEVNTPRQIAMFFVKKNTKLTLKSIGFIFGKRDHTTVMSAVKNVNNQFDVSKPFRANIMEISVKLEQYLKC